MNPKPKKKVLKNVWWKHVKAIEGSRVETIKDLVTKLNPGPGKKALVKGVTKADATEMLVDIGLSAFPFGRMFKHEVCKFFKGDPERVDFKTIVKALEEICKKTEIGDEFKNRLEEAITQAKSGKLENPFKSSISLSDHPVTARVFGKTILDEVAIALKLKESEINKVKQRYGSRNQFMRTRNGQISKATGIESNKVKLFKEALSWSTIEGVSAPLAVAFASTGKNPEEIIEMNVQDVKKSVDGSGVSVPKKDNTQKHLGDVLESVKKAFPDRAYFNDVIKFLKLPTPIKEMLKTKKVHTFGDLRRKKLYKEVLAKIEDKEMKTLWENYSRLAGISQNFKLNQKLIEDGIRSCYQISKMPVKLFKARYKGLADKNDLEMIYYRAYDATTKNFPIATTSYLLSKNHNLDRIIRFSRVGREIKKPTSNPGNLSNEVYIRPEDVSPEGAKKVLDFLNAAKTTKEIDEKVEIPRERDVGVRVGERILDRRGELGVFQNLQEVYDIKYIGPEIFTEIVMTIAGPLEYPSRPPCECPHCESVLSPSAYLLALLHFVEDYFGKDYTYLFDDRMHRAGLKDLDLTCELADEPVPHIKIVIEVLKEYIRRNLNITEEKIWERLGESVYPSLYFYHGMRFKQYLSVLGTSLEEVHYTFRDPEEESFLEEYLSELVGITYPELQLLINSANREMIAEILGVSVTDLKGAMLESDPEIKTRKLAGYLGLSVDDFTVLISAPYISVGGSVVNVDIKSFDKLRRASHLSVALGISAEGLMRVLEIIDPSDLNKETVEEIYRVVALSRELGISCIELSALVHIRSEEELVELLELVDQQELEAIKTSPQSLARVFKISEDEVEVVLGFLAVDLGELDLPHIINIYQWSKLAQVSGISVATLINLMKTMEPQLTDIESFEQLLEVVRHIRGASKIGTSVEEMTNLHRNLERTELEGRLCVTPEEFDELISSMNDTNLSKDERKGKLSSVLAMSEEDLDIIFRLGIKDGKAELSSIDSISSWQRIEVIHRAVRMSQLIKVTLEELELSLNLLEITYDDITYDEIFRIYELVSLVRLLGLELAKLALLPLKAEKKILARIGFVQKEWKDYTQSDQRGKSEILCTKLQVSNDELSELFTKLRQDNSIQLDLSKPVELDKIYRCVRLSKLSGKSLVEFYTILTELSEENADLDKLLNLYILTDLLGKSPEVVNSGLESLGLAVEGINNYLYVCILKFALDNLDQLLKATGLVSLKNVNSLRKVYWLYRINSLARSLGLSVEELTSLNLWEHEVNRDDVEDILSILRSMYEEAQLEEELVEPNKRIWIATRDALRNYAVSPNITKNHPDAPTTVKDLSDLLLIDLKIAPCHMTTEIQQAIESVQTFALQARTGQEEGIELPNKDKRRLMEEEWRWLKRYVLWEAAMKVYLYPENYVFPQLRDDKTPFFQELEDELSQGEVTQAAARKAISGYIEKLHEISALRVSGAVYEETTDTLHIFARSQVGEEKPTYYRTLKEQRIWTPWVKMEAEINTDKIYPILAYDRLYTFWIETEEEKERNDGGEEVRKYKHKLCYCYTIEKDKWCKKKIYEFPNEELDTIPEPTLESFSKEVINIGIANHLYQIACNDRLKESSSYGAIWPEVILQGSTGDPSFLRFLSETNSNVMLDNQYRGNGTMSREKKVLNTLYVRNLQLEFLSADLVGHEMDMDVANISVCETLLTVERSFHVEDAIEIENCIFFFCSDQYRCLMIVANLYEEEGTKKARFSICQLNYGKYCKVADKLFQEGLDEFFDPEFQKANLDPEFNDIYGPIADQVMYIPCRKLEFHGPNKAYNWELFFHIPYLIADGLNQNRKFEDAARWFHYIYNPYTEDEEKIWRFLPFNKGQIEQLEEYIKDPEDAKVWGADPYSPHALARVRPGTYQKAVILSYIRNLLEWADQEFTLDTREAINRARERYEFAEELLKLKDIEEGEELCELLLSNKSLTEIMEEISTEASLSDVMQVAEDYYVDLYWGLVSLKGSTGCSMGCLPVEWIAPKTSSNGSLVGAAASAMSIFMMTCIPENDIFETYRNHIQSNLMKIRTCKNIAGIQRILPIFEASIDPMSIVRAVASGLGPDAVNFTNASAIGPYRFSYLVERAKGLANLVAQTGNALLTAIEKKESEELSLLKAQQELNLAKKNVYLRKLQVVEAEDGKELAVRQSKRAETQKEHFQGLIDDGKNQWENRALEHLETSQNCLIASAVFQGLSALYSLAPTISISAGLNAGVSTSFGGSNIAGFWGGLAGVMSTTANIFSSKSQAASMEASFERREEDWTLQRDLAEKEKLISEQQELLADDRIVIAECEKEIAEMQADNADQMLEFLKEKFTNKELYAWMVRTLSKILYGFYNLAYSTAKMAEATFQFERNMAQEFISYGYWDSEKKGLLSGDQLLLDITQMDQNYIENNARKLEITKHLSLASLAPEVLFELKSNGKTTFRSLMSWFDRDFPGHYQRIIKSVKVSVLALIPPTSGVNATLSTTSPSIVVLDPLNPEESIVGIQRIQSVALSASSNATGLFELNYRDERYLPFEGCGVDVTWELEMPKASNKFDFNSIVDVILSIDYTALSDYTYKKEIISQLGTETGGMLPLSVWAGFPDAWYHLHNPIWLKPLEGNGDPYAAGDTPRPYCMKLVITRDMFPPNETEHRLEHIGLRFALKDINVKIPLHVKYVSERGETFEDSRSTDSDGYLLIENGIPYNSVPFGTWEITVIRDTVPQILLAKNDDGSSVVENVTDPSQPHPVLDTDKITDLIIAITYSAKLEWPSEV